MKVQAEKEGGIRSPPIISAIYIFVLNFCTLPVACIVSVIITTYPSLIFFFITNFPCSNLLAF